MVIEAFRAVSSPLKKSFVLTIILFWRLRVRKLFKGGNYSREETIDHLEVLTVETIQRRKVFKGGNYMRKYGILKCKQARYLRQVEVC